MNFMGGSRQGGFYEEEQYNKGKLTSSPYSSSSSPSSSSSQSQHRGLLLPPLTYHQYHQHPRGWLEPTTQDQEETPLRCYNNNNSSSINGREKGSATQAQLELMMDSSSPGNNGTDDTGDDAMGMGMGMGMLVVEKEHMFDKVVTPSDVGKLNRLVIPKQHAEKYFPLDSSTNDKGLLLNFEDRNGKPWRFRYSYWNSSQSYVMTKGWSRFVKEKKLDAGDIVSFQRGVGDLGKDRLFIDWRRRPDAPESLPRPPHHFSVQRSWNPLYLQQPHPNSNFLYPTTTAHPPQSHSHSHSHPNAYAGAPYNCHVVNPCSGSVIYFRSAGGAPQQVGMMQMQRGGGGVEPVVFDSVPVVHGKAAAKRLRLFGVNMECPISESDECDILTATTIPHNATMLPQQPPPHISSSSSSSIPYLQLRPYNGTPLPTVLPSSNVLSKGKASMSLDLDI